MPSRLSPPHAAFRQLRALKEASRGEQENRIVDDFVLHPNAMLQSDDELLGFSQTEVLNAYGGRSHVTSTCGACPVNRARTSNGWAECFGVVPLWEDERELRELALNCSKLMDKETNSGLRHFRKTDPHWYSLFLAGELHGDALSHANQVAAIIQQHLEATNQCWPEFNEWRMALVFARNNQLTMQVEYFPPGESNETAWFVPGHCGICKCLRPRAGRPCRVCGEQGFWVESAKKGVLGLRPYLKLLQVVGPETVAKIRQILQ